MGALAGTTGDLGLEVLRLHAAAFREHAARAGDGDNPEDVHQTRVATRRMRAAIRVFGDVLPSAVADLSAELKWIAGDLGRVRDLDVQIERIQHDGVSSGVLSSLEAYAGWLEEQRQCALGSLREALRAERFISLAQRLAGVDDWEAVDAPPVEVDGPRRLRRAYESLRKRAKSLDEGSAAAELHKARIRAKRLRYAAEFFDSVYGGPAQKLVRRAVDLQDLLGDHQDGVVCRQRIHGAVHSSDRAWASDTVMALGRVVQLEVERGALLRRRAPRVYRRVDKAWRRLKSDF
jgi:triphosphatase